VEVHRSRIMRKMDMKTLRDTLRIVLVLRSAGGNTSLPGQAAPASAAQAR
jgi:hypothetical protein